MIVSQTTNMLFDLMLGALFRVFGAEVAQRISVSIAVLVFVWGAFRFHLGGGGRRAWHCCRASRCWPMAGSSTWASSISI